MNYRSDIDGLRTIAVFLVILGHAGFTTVSGGFIGVDVFFVISGFLITSIIAPKIKDKTFSIGWFLSRRIKRLMPVLFFIIAASVLLFSFVMLPQDLVKFYRSIIWVILYGANFFFWREHGGYFDGNSSEVPLLHTWSLAVEEQYYLVWPIMLMVMFKFLGPKRTIALSLFICIVATIFSQWGTEVTIGAAYYLLPTRFFELLVGSCLALGWRYLPKPSSIIQNTLSLFGLALIIFGAFYLTEHHSFPGYNALYPVIGTALIIYANGGLVSRFLSTKPMVYSGNISYSLYLWHWPILAFIRYSSIELTLLVQLAVIALTYILSMFSYRFIEEPFRNIKLNQFTPIALKLYCLPAALIIAFVLFGINQKGFENRFSDELVIQEKALNSFASDSRKNCHSALRDSERLPQKNCTIGQNKPNEIKVFVIGDSHANHIVPFIDVLTKDATLTGQDYTLDRCLPFINLGWGSNLYKANVCKNRNELAFNHVRDNQFDYVVLAASWPEIATRRIFTERRVTDDGKKLSLLTAQFEKTLDWIKSSGAIPVIVEDIPTLGGLSPKCTIKKELFNQALNCETSRNKNELIGELIQKIQISNPDVVIIKPQELICKNNVCQMAIGGIPLYRDEDHLNEVGAAKLGENYIKQFGNPLVAKNIKPILSSDN